MCPPTDKALGDRPPCISRTGLHNIAVSEVPRLFFFFFFFFLFANLLIFKVK